MNDDTILGGALNQLGQTAKKTVQQAVNLPDEMPREEKKEEAASAKGSGEPKWKSDEERVAYLKGLYGSEKKIEDKLPEEQKKLIELRNKLHKEEYYDPTFNPVKKQEERPAEKVENEKKKEMIDLQKKEEKKPPPLAVVREQNKAEMFRGASG